MKLSIIERHLKSLEHYLESDLRQRFYSTEYLRGIAQQRNEILERQGRAVGATFLLTGLVIISESTSASLTIGGMNLQIGTSLRVPLTLLLSFSILSAVLTTLDQMIIERYISTIGAKANLWSFQIVIADLTARNLWVDPITPKFFGLRSRKGHKLAFGLVGFNSLAIVSLMIFLPASTIIATVYKTLIGSSSVLEKIVAAGSFFVLFCSITFLLFFHFAKFEFDEADFDEVSGEPTKEFLAKLEAEAEHRENSTS